MQGVRSSSLLSSTKRVDAAAFPESADTGAKSPVGNLTPSTNHRAIALGPDGNPWIATASGLA